MPTNLQLDLQALLAFMDGNIETVNTTATDIQELIYTITRDGLLNFDTVNGRFDIKQDWRARLISIEDAIENTLKIPVWTDTVTEFLSSFSTIQDRNVSLNRTYNQLAVDVDQLTPARKYIYEQAKQSLKSGLKTAYVTPAVNLLMQQVTGGASITESLELLDRWNKDELASGRYTNGKPTPNLQRYATQIARDSSYSVDRTISGIIKDRYELDDVMYVGGLVRDSRPFCVHMVQHAQPVPMETVAEYIRQYPQGLYPDTDTENFMQRCGGYACKHKAFAVRRRANNI